jgi:predicted nucleotidyltransferase
LNTANLIIREAYVFGSYAQGRQNEWSDIDLALVSDQFEGNFFNDRSKLSSYVVRTDSDIETHPFRTEDFNAGNPFVEEILRTGVRIV